MKNNKHILRFITAICLVGTSVVSANAQDTTESLSDQLNAAKQKVQELSSERSVFGSDITAVDFIRYHAQINNDTDTTKYLEDHQYSTDPADDISLTTLQDEVKYIADINTLRLGSSLEALKISDEYMMAASYDIIEPGKLASTCKAEVMPVGTVTTLSNNLSAASTASIGIYQTTDQKYYDIVTGTDNVTYSTEDYQKDLTTFIDKYITAYQTAENNLKTIQAAYDASLTAAKNTAVYAESATPTPTSTTTATATPTPTATAAPTPTPVATPTPVEFPQLMYRMYNPNSGEHFYTGDILERNNLVSYGWTYEGIGWRAPKTSNSPVYRLYNANGGEHHYTLDANERDHLVSVGWRYEGIGWYSDDNKTVPLYRQYNPNAYACNHNYTTSKAENDWLVTVGWNAEGIGWYGVAGSSYYEGIDISEHNGDINIKQYKPDFVIIRAGWGWGVEGEDKNFIRNVQLCESLGIPYGVYWYSYATNVTEAEMEAKTFISFLQKCHPTVGAWMDMEDADHYKVKIDAGFFRQDLVSQLCQAFCASVQSAGYHTGIYASRYVFDDYIRNCDQYDKWLAQWHENDGTFTDESSFGASLHQYTSNPIDRDVMYVDIAKFRS